MFVCREYIIINSILSANIYRKQYNHVAVCAEAARQNVRDFNENLMMKCNLSIRSRDDDINVM